MNGSGVTYTPFAYDAKGNTTHDGYFSYSGDRGNLFWETNKAMELEFK